ncbi:sorting nexin-21 isoform X1 [Anopheles aquasalis]|uniref:sorting nexin-21 isoform X1 n=1 Tax=Anopheles aquasalis TaxID=42839 RepID=UPI00215B1131|nr:sorting nexin-21 isoform X1 [Anopheles aquasalis]XP_050089304.1 sorting nexin-21 isoform X1 [Anopheles aquasalis]
MENGESIEEDVDSATEVFDESTLSIKTSACGSVVTPAVWKRFHRRQRYNDTVPLHFEIIHARILPAVATTELTADASGGAGGNNAVKKYVVYVVNVREDGHPRDPRPTSIDRRYTHFLKLYEGLRKDHPTLVQGVAFPKKVLMGNFTPELIGERSGAFELFLDHIMSVPLLRESEHFLEFLQHDELTRACQLLDERRNEQAVPLLENSFRLLNKLFLDKSKAVLLLLCRLVVACTSSPIPHAAAEQWAELALRRFEHVCDTELLVLYIPLLQTCLHLWWQRGRDRTLLEERLNEMGKKGIKVKGGPTLGQAIHALDPRAETI